MSDLVKRLRQGCTASHIDNATMWEAADRIEYLERRVAINSLWPPRRIVASSEGLEMLNRMQADLEAGRLGFEPSLPDTVEIENG